MSPMQGKQCEGQHTVVHGCVHVEHMFVWNIASLGMCLADTRLPRVYPAWLQPLR